MAAQSNQERREELQADELRFLLVRALRVDGLGSVCRDEPATYDDLSIRLSQVVTTAMALGMTFVFSDWAGLAFWAWLAITALLAFLLGLLAWKAGPTLGVTVLFGSWLVVSAIQLAEQDADDFLLTLALPFAITSGIWAAVRGGRLTTVIRSAPLVLPITLIVLLVPLFTEDLWEAADALSGLQLGFAALLTVLPLSLVFRHQLRVEAPRAAAEGVKVVAADPDGAGKTVDRLLKLVDDDKVEGLRRELEPRVERAWKDQNDAASLVEGSLRGQLRGQLVRRLFTTAVGLAIGVTAYIYALAWALISVSVATTWTEKEIPLETVALLGLSVDLPLGPYLSVAGLLGVLATALLLAFVTTEERYAREMSATLLSEPLKERLPPALTYAALYPEAIHS